MGWFQPYLPVNTIQHLSSYPRKVNSPNFSSENKNSLLEVIATRWQHCHIPSLRHRQHSFIPIAESGIQSRKYKIVSGEEGGKYSVFTGKYGNINFKMKITYYPTFPVNTIEHDSQHYTRGGDCTKNKAAGEYLQRDYT